MVDQHFQGMACSSNTSIQLFRMIVSNDPKAVEELRHIFKTSDCDISLEYRFKFYRTPQIRSHNFCDCWFIHEYFEYISSHDVNGAILDRLIRYIEAGHCDHVPVDETENVCTTGVSLIHLAIAADNKPIVKYLMTKDRFQLYRKTRFVEHSPLTLAILKDSTKVIKFIKYRPTKEYGYGVFKDELITNFNMILAKREENGKVKIIERPGYRYSATSVYCFFIGAVPSKKIIRHIFPSFENEDVTAVLRYIIYVHSRATSLDIIEGFFPYVSVFSSELVLEAIVWDKPEVLNKILERGIEEYSIYSKNDLLHVCKFLGHSECSEVLQYKLNKSFRKRQETNVTSDIWKREDPSYRKKNFFLSANVSPYIFLLHFYSRHSSMYDVQRICSLFANISKQNYNPNEKDKYGMTCLHNAVEHIDNVNDLTVIINTLCRLGCDCNAEDVNGRSALFAALTPINSPLGVHNSHHRCDAFWIVKHLLYHNAVPKSTPMAVFYSIELDKNNGLLDYEVKHGDDLTKSAVSESKNKNTHKIVIDKTTRDRYLAISLVAILLELGFPAGRFEQISFSKIHAKLEQYMTDTLSTPRTLKCLCRNTIRHRFPGPMLQRYLESIRIPDTIVDFILCKQFLCRQVA